MELDRLCITESISLRAAMTQMTAVRTGILMVVDADFRLLGTLTDGDLRRAIIAGLDLDQSVAEVTNRHPVTASPDATREALINLMQVSQKLAVPLIDAEGRVAGLEQLTELIRPTAVSHTAVILAGGYGKRMRPFTDRLPKPMLPVGGKPILELIVDQLVQYGFRQVVMLLHYLPTVIENYFSARLSGIEVEFVVEQEPLGTAGGLSLVRERLKEPFLVLNGDTLVRADWRNMFTTHADQGNLITVGAAEYTVQVPYGVLDASHGRITGIAEKPRLSFMTVCSAYCLSPEVLGLIEPGTTIGMPDLIQAVLERQGRVGLFQLSDISRIEDLAPSHGELWAREM